MNSNTTQCNWCNGTGFRSFDCPPDTPMMFRPIGVWRCEFCYGSGNHPKLSFSNNTAPLDKELDDATVEHFKDLLEEIIDEAKQDNNPQ